jgi:hypothetical protein
MRPTRLLTGLVSMALLVVGLVALLPDCASACLCAWNPRIPEQERAERALDRSSAVFAGEVVNIKGSLVPERPGHTVYIQVDTVFFRVSEVWKGPEQDTLEVTTPRGEAACGYPFSEGRTYLVYADGKRMEVSACGETTPLSEARADLEALGNGESMGGGGALVDTSGGFLGSWIIGMLGLAMAAVSSVVLLRLLRTS